MDNLFKIECELESVASKLKSLEPKGHGELKALENIMAAISLIKQERKPVEIFIWKYADCGFFGDDFYQDKNNLEKARKGMSGKAIKFREVIE